MTDCAGFAKVDVKNSKKIKRTRNGTKFVRFITPKPTFK
jgi:hypothetical protein